MTTATFIQSPEADYDYTDTHPGFAVGYAGSGTEQRAQLQTIARRTYTWHMRKTASERSTIDTHFVAVDYMTTAFYIKDPKDFARTGVSLGTATSAQTSFSLPTTGEEQRDYMIDDANVVVYDDASPTGTTVTVNTDARTVGLSTAPASDSVMTVDYHTYRLVRLQAPFRWRMLAPDFFECFPRLVEVPS